MSPARNHALHLSIKNTSSRGNSKSNFSHVYEDSKGIIVCSDALKFLEHIDEKSADIVFLDPPFNLGKQYGRSSSKADLKEEKLYLAYLSKVLERSAVILKDGGALYLYHIPNWAFRLANILEQHLVFRHWIAISMKNGFVRGKRLYPAHYSLLYFTKGEPANFFRPKLSPPTCRHCHKLTKDYGGYKDFVRDGINLGDIWEDLSPVRHKKYKHRPPNELPLEIPRRAVRISGVSRGILVDPFGGTGTSLIAAVESNMRFLACDSKLAYCKLMHDRVRCFTGASKNNKTLRLKNA